MIRPNCDSGNVIMSVCSPVSLSSINAVVLKGRAQLLISSNTCGLWSQGKSSLCSIHLCPGKSEIQHGGLSVYTTLSCPNNMGQTIRGGYLGSCFSNQRGNTEVLGSVGPQRRNLEISLASQRVNMRLLVPKRKLLPKVKRIVGPITWPHGCVSAGLIFGLLVCNSSSQLSHAESDSDKESKKDNCEESYVKFLHGKKVYTDYSVIGELHILPTINFFYSYIYTNGKIS